MMDIGEDYIVLVDLVFRLVESQSGKKLESIDAWKNDAQTLSRKLFHHLTSIQSISGGTSIGIGDEVKFAFIDHSSTIVVARAALETYLVFHHIYGEGFSDLSKFRHALWKLGGLASRQNYPTLKQESKDKIESEKEQIEKLRLEVKKHPEFEQYTSKQQKQLLFGNWRVDKSWQDLGEVANFHPDHFMMTYSFLCGYSHASYISALQVGQAQTIEEQRDLAMPMLQIGGIIMAHFCHSYIQVFESAKPIFEQDQLAKNVAKNWHLTRERMNEIYKH